MSIAATAPPKTPGERRVGPADRGFLRVIHGWAYAASRDAGETRDLRLDLLRGFCIFAMVVDHIGGDSWLYAITGGNRFYVSAAEGFVFLSGYTVGQAYHRKIDRGGLADAMLDALRRARTLYFATVALTLVFSALYLYTDISLWVGRDFSLGIEDPRELVVAAMTLHYTYHGTDILAMYAIFVAVAPIALLLLAFGRWWIVAGGSIAWWWAFQLYPERASFPWPILHADNFPLGAWQILFFVGMALGFQREPFTRWLHRWPEVRVVLVAFGAMLTLTLISVFWSQQSGNRLPPALPFALFDIDPSALDERFFKVSLRPWRLLAFAAAAIAAYTLATYLWRPVRVLTGWLLLPLGQHALYSYIVHFFLILVVFNLAPSVLDVAMRNPPPQLVETLLQLTVVATLWVMIRRRVLFWLVPN